MDTRLLLVGLFLAYFYQLSFLPSPRHAKLMLQLSLRSAAYLTLTQHNTYIDTAFVNYYHCYHYYYYYHYYYHYLIVPR